MSNISVDSFEDTTHPFIVKIWLEESVEEAGRATWRGHITHVPSGERRYIEDLDDIRAFIVPYLEGMGVRFHKSRGAQRYLRRLRMCLGRKLRTGGRGSN